MKLLSDEPIINSLLDTDFYKFTMGQLVFRRYRDVEVTFSLINRARIPFAQYFSEEDLRRELDHVMKLRLRNSEYHYLRGTHEYGDKMFQDDYLQFLRDLELPPYKLIREGDDYRLEFTGPWPKVMYWETLAMSIICELYSRALLRKKSRFEQEAVFARGVQNLLEKICVFRHQPFLTFSDFGTRRRFSRAWQQYVVEVMREELPGILLGTSNVLFAKDVDLIPMGTSAHELPMVIAALAFAKAHPDTRSEDVLIEAQREVLNGWWSMYGRGLSIALTDTFTTDFFLRAANQDVAKLWKGTRQDSGDPFSYGEKMINWYRRYDENPKDKLTVFSDKLDPARMVALHAHFQGRLGHTFGVGTNLTNDLGLPTAEIVVKASRVNGRSTVKLSDDPAKAMGDLHEVTRYRQVIGLIPV